MEINQQSSPWTEGRDLLHAVTVYDGEVWLVQILCRDNEADRWVITGSLLLTREDKIKRIHFRQNSDNCRELGSTWVWSVRWVG